MTDLVDLKWYPDSKGMVGPLTSELGIDHLYKMDENQLRQMLVDYIYNFERSQKNVAKLQARVEELQEMVDGLTPAELMPDE